MAYRSLRSGRRERSLLLSRARSKRFVHANYLNMIVAEQSVKAPDPDGWAVLLDVNGNLDEGMGSSIFFVSRGHRGLAQVISLNYITSAVSNFCSR